MEEAFRTLPGVIQTTVGYAGGRREHPTYEQVCSDATGHAEVVRVEFDPTKISYEKLLDVFFSSHNPTTRNRQGPDIGSQYRSVIFFTDPKQEEIALNTIDRLSKEKRWSKPIVTEVIAAPAFWEAEDYHQQYLLKQGRSSCHL